MWWERQQGSEAGLGNSKHITTLMAYLKPTKSNMVDDATCQLCVKQEGTLHFSKPVYNRKGTIWLFDIFGKTFVNQEVG
jgi:hypothetical protein